jgi:hypothetical protein
MAQDPIAAIGPAIADALRKGNKIEAIKLLRQASGLGLAEAKSTVERFERAGGAEKASSPKQTGPVGAKPASTHHVYQPRPGLSPGQVAPSSSGPIAAVVVIALIAAAVAGYFLVV